jgi:hypothetical protein
MDQTPLNRAIPRLLDLQEAGQPFTPGQEIVYLAFFMDAEVHNGGFDQFFFNSQGNHAAETLDALRTVGAPRSADLLRRACAAFAPEMPSPDRDVRWQQMDRLPKDLREGWNALDSLYYECGENIPALLSAYIEAHPVEFK